MLFISFHFANYLLIFICIFDRDNTGSGLNEMRLKSLKEPHQ